MNRLKPACKIYYAKAGMAKPDIFVDIDSRLVWSPVTQSAGHTNERVKWYSVTAF
jgi:hypothetical protein